MNTLAWNCRGLGNPLTVQELCNFVNLHHPNLVFLSETRISANRSKNLCWKLGLKNCLAVDSDGLSGGLVLFWDEHINVSLLSQGERYIKVLVCDNPDEAPWRATFVYGEPRLENRRDMWELLRSLCGVWTSPWLVLGDFNEAMWQYEHFSETPRPELQMMDFREVLSHCDLHDLGFSGLPWTYNNNQGGVVMFVLDWIGVWPTLIGCLSFQELLFSILRLHDLTTKPCCSLPTWMVRLPAPLFLDMKLCGKGKRN